MSDPFDDVAKEAGFADAAELHRMVASVDLTKPGMIARFKQWQTEDGSKRGLEELLRD